MTKAKNIFCGLVILLAVVATGEASACGSVGLWHRNYCEAETLERKLNALIYLHCDPVVDNYRSDSAESALLGHMLFDALQKSDSLKSTNSENAAFLRNLVLKNYVRFKLYEIPFAKQDLLVNKLAESFEAEPMVFLERLKALNDNHPLHRSEGMGSSQYSYADQLAREVQM